MVRIYFDCYFFLLGDLHSIPRAMSENASHVVSFDGPVNDKVQLHDVGCTSTICILPTHGKEVFHVMSVMFNMLQIKGLFGVKPMRTPICI